MLNQKITLSVLTLVLACFAGREVRAGSRAEVDAARRAANTAWYNVKLSRERLGQFGRKGVLAKSWNRLYSAAVKKSPDYGPAHQQFRADINTLSQHWDDVIAKANAAIRGYYARYAAEYSWYITGNRAALPSLKKQRDQDIQSMRNLIEYCKRSKADARKYWYSHLSKLPR